MIVQRFLFFITLVITLSSAPLLAASSTPNIDDQKTFSVNIPATSLKQALAQLAKKTSTHIIFRSDAVVGLTTVDLKGQHSLESALTQLLSNTGLKYKFIEGNFVTVIRPKTNNRATHHHPENAYRLSEDPSDIQEVIIVGETRTTGCCQNTPSTATRTYTPTIEVAKSLEGIGSELLKDRGNATLSEAFRDYSSVNVTDLGGAINVRGFHLPRSAILFDGHSNISYGTAPLTLNNIEGIEVAKGANTTLYGFGEPGAIINLVTKKPKKVAFTDITVNYGNYDRYFAIDTNGQSPLDSNLLQRFNLLIREDEAEHNTQGSIKQIEASPSFGYQINETDSILLALNYFTQKVDGNEGQRAFDNVVDNNGFFDLNYAGIPVSTTQFYPYSGYHHENETHKSETWDINTNYQAMTDGGWDLLFNAYYGENTQNKRYATDQIIQANTIFDARGSSEGPLTYITNLFVAGDFILNYQDLRRDFFGYIAEEHGIGVWDIVPTVLNGGDDFPLWQDNQMRFYQTVSRQRSNSDNFNLNFSSSKEFSLKNTEHFILLGASHRSSTTRLKTKQLYNKELFSNGEDLISADATDNDLYLGWALRRYAMYPWYFPFNESSPSGIVLPHAISAQLGIDSTREFPLDGSFLQKYVKVDTRVSGIYIQDQISFNEQWKALVSAGFYHYHRESKSTTLDPLRTLIGDRRYLDGEFDGDDAVFSPQLGLTYLPRTDVSIYANYGKQYNILENVTSTNKPFKPADTSTYEIGSKWWPSEALNLSVAFFQITKNNWPITDIDEALYLTQAGKLRSRGGEFNLTGFMTPHIKMALNFAKTSVKSLKNPEGSRADTFVNLTQNGVPESNGSLWLQYHTEPFGKRGWSIGAGATYMGKREYNVQAVESTFDRYTLIDTALAYRDEDFRIALNIDNVTNKDWVIGTSLTPTGSKSPSYLSAGHGVRYRLSTQMFF